METVDASQHQSSHQKDTPWRSKLCCREKFDSAWGTELQSQTLQAPLVHDEDDNVWPATRWAAGSLGSLSSMLEWMFKVTSTPFPAAQCKKAAGSGKKVGFHSQPFQSLGAFQSVSRDSVSRGTWWATKAG